MASTPDTWQDADLRVRIPRTDRTPSIDLRIRCRRSGLGDIAIVLICESQRIDRGGRALRVRDAGDPGGAEVMYFHGPPSSRLDLCLANNSRPNAVSLVSFDRPGYGGSTPAPFGLASIAADAHAVADELGIAGSPRRSVRRRTWRSRRGLSAEHVAYGTL